MRVYLLICLFVCLFFSQGNRIYPVVLGCFERTHSNGNGKF